jgi:hypothetical protein
MKSLHLHSPGSIPSTRVLPLMPSSHDPCLWTTLNAQEPRQTPKHPELQVPYSDIIVLQADRHQEAKFDPVNRRNSQRETERRNNHATPNPFAQGNFTSMSRPYRQYCRLVLSSYPRNVLVESSQIHHQVLKLPRKSYVPGPASPHQHSLVLRDLKDGHGMPKMCEAWKERVVC